MFELVLPGRFFPANSSNKVPLRQCIADVNKMHIGEEVLSLTSCAAFFTAHSIVCGIRYDTGVTTCVMQNIRGS